MSRLGLFGGTFDPPHHAHRRLCEAARNLLALDGVAVLPVADPPHGKTPAAGAWHRWAMVVLAFRDAAGLIPSPRELERGGVSYTVQTLRDLVRERPGETPYLIIGGDSYDELPTWYRFEEILDLAHLAVVDRPGSAGTARLRPGDRERVAEPGSAPPKGRTAVYRVPMDPADLAASRLREELAGGKRPEGLDPLVYDYIAAHGLYGVGRHSTGGI